MENLYGKIQNTEDKNAQPAKKIKLALKLALAGAIGLGTIGVYSGYNYLKRNYGGCDVDFKTTSDSLGRNFVGALEENFTDRPVDGTNKIGEDNKK